MNHLGAEVMRKIFSGFGKGQGWEKFRQRPGRGVPE
jgi:hypothetical protein